MKLLLPLILALLTAACAMTPEEKATDHQRLLHEQARENFIRERELARVRSGRAPRPTPPPQSLARYAKPLRLKPFQTTSATPQATPQRLAKAKPQPVLKKPQVTPKPKAASKPQPTAKQKQATKPQPAAKPKPAPKPQKPRKPRPDDTIYESSINPRAKQREWELHQAERYRVYEAREAKRLGKKPSELSREERRWIRQRYQ